MICIVTVFFKSFVPLKKPQVQIPASKSTGSRFVQSSLSVVAQNIHKYRFSGENTVLFLRGRKKDSLYANENKMSTLNRESPELG
jgi:hypothetical protein